MGAVVKQPQIQYTDDRGIGLFLVLERQFVQAAAGT